MVINASWRISYDIRKEMADREPVRGSQRDWGNGGGWNGDSGNQGDLRIIRAYYGMGNQNEDVTRELQRQISKLERDRR